MPYRHVSVMLPEVIHYLNCQPGGRYVDGTLGGCGHARAICKAAGARGTLIGIDQDPGAIANAHTVLSACPGNIRLVHDNFAHLPKILARLDIDAVDGILLDLGISLDQLEESGRGFSFQLDEPLDMRMNAAASTTAADIVNSFPEKRLASLLRDLGEERWAKRIARRIVMTREEQKIVSSRQLAQVVSAAVPSHAQGRQRIHPATRVFMALRIAVNRELERLEDFMAFAAEVLKPGGRLCILAFHSLEDRIVKHRLRTLARDCVCPPEFPRCVCNHQQMFKVLTPKAVRPGNSEVAQNPLARSTRLRAAERISVPTGLSP